MSGPARTPTSTYRLQLRADALTLDDACALVDYLDDLGISHLYLSPVLTAAPGSTHGYDVTDPTTVSQALGGREALVRLAHECRTRGMGVVIDIVPNHLGVARAEDNRYWWDVLRCGDRSAYRDLFDIDRHAGRIALPVLGDDADVAALIVDRSGPEPVLSYYDNRFPIDPATDDGCDDAATVHDRQPYRLVGWRSGQVGYRRFFTVSDLAAVRQEDPAVFDLTHREIASWFTEDLVDGLRIDHPDGLADPAGYLARVRSILGENRWLVIEKILTGDEHLDPTLPVDGTTGYDALADLGGVFVDPAGEVALTEVSRRYTGTPGDRTWLRENEFAIKSEILRTELTAEVRRVVDAVVRDDPESGGVDRGALTAALIEVITRIPTYRTDYTPLAGVLDGILDTVARDDGDRIAAIASMARAVGRGGESATRTQQLAGAAMAKSVEDTLFYRTARLVSLQEVGGDPARFGCSPSRFHARLADRAATWPAAMTTLSTHDTKRGEDVRARIGVLAQVPADFSRELDRWSAAAPPLDGQSALLLWQNIIGTWPVTGEITDTYRDRLRGYAQKAMREAGLHTSWSEVDESFEGSIEAWLDAILTSPIAESVTRFVRLVAPHGWSDALGQKLLQILGPGVPDVYQGTELWEDSLVDPDNRRPVDVDARRRVLAATTSAPPVDASGAAKLWVTACALRVRRARPASFVGGSYAPVEASGPAADHLVGFARGPAGGDCDVIAVATRLSVGLRSSGWGPTTVTLPEGRWRDLLTGRDHSGVLEVGTVLDALPVALLIRA